MAARLREAQSSLVELRAPFTVARQAVDDVERGAQDSDWQSVKDAAKQIAFAEDRAILHGCAPAGIGGIVPGSSNPAMALPADVRQLPDTVAQALSALRLAGVRPRLPIREHLARLPHDAEVIWAPALDGALLHSTRGGDYEPHLGQDLSIGYLSHGAEHIELYLQESLTFLAFTAEFSVPLGGGGAAGSGGRARAGCGVE